MTSPARITAGLLLAVAGLGSCSGEAGFRAGAGGADVDGSATVDTVTSAGAGPPGPAPPGMVWVPGGEFTMGWDGPEARPDERPAHRVRVDGFWMDATEVTNAQFAAFADATGYLTVAERPVVWEELAAQLPPGTPRVPDEDLAPGSLVFTPPAAPVPLTDASRWWAWVPGANWRHPEGPGSDLRGRDDFPVVHVSWEDAVAYCRWAGKRLPTEAEWERAARFGHDGEPYAWGHELAPGGVHRANTWQGDFPHAPVDEDGHLGIAPVGAYPANALGLHDLAGNVWEWTADRFDPGDYARRVAALPQDGCCVNPSGPEATRDPRHPFARDSRVQKGGSFLCHVSYCASYRPSAKMGSTPDSAWNHLGFRGVRSP